MSKKPWYRLALGAAKFWLFSTAAAGLFGLLWMIGYIVLNDTVMGVVLLAALITIGAMIVVAIGESDE